MGHFCINARAVGATRFVSIADNSNLIEILVLFVLVDQWTSRIAVTRVYAFKIMLLRKSFEVLPPITSFSPSADLRIFIYFIPLSCPPSSPASFEIDIRQLSLQHSGGGHIEV